MRELEPPASGIGARIPHTPTEMRYDVSVWGEVEIVSSLVRELSVPWSAVTYAEVLEHVRARAQATWSRWHQRHRPQADPWSGAWPWERSHQT